jgi:hypothetical protein
LRDRDRAALDFGDALAVRGEGLGVIAAADARVLGRVCALARSAPVATHAPATITTMAPMAIARRPAGDLRCSLCEAATNASVNSCRCSRPVLSRDLSTVTARLLLFYANPGHAHAC